MRIDRSSAGDQMMAQRDNSINYGFRCFMDSCAGQARLSLPHE
jgi:hypothetical protein